jgi:hypothetical protein
MNHMMNAGAAAAAAAAAAKAIKASGTIVHVEADEFRRLVNQNPDGLVVHAAGGLFSASHKYLMSYKGLAFYTSTGDPITLPSRYQVVEAKKIWMP